MKISFGNIAIFGLNIAVFGLYFAIFGLNIAVSKFSMKYQLNDITFHKAGYADQTITVSVNDGETTLVNTKLVKS